MIPAYSPTKIPEFPFFLALSIAVSRIVLGMHFLSDVLSGVVMGVALGCASITAFASFGLI